MGSCGDGNGATENRQTPFANPRTYESVSQRTASDSARPDVERNATKTLQNFGKKGRKASEGMNSRDMEEENALRCIVQTTSHA